MKTLVIGAMAALLVAGCHTPVHQASRSDLMNRVLTQLDLIQPGCDCQVVELPDATRIPQLADTEETTIDWPRDHHFHVVVDRANGRFWVERTIKGETTTFGPGELRKE